VFIGCGHKDATGPVPPVDNTYHIEIRYYGPDPSAQTRAAFDAAAARIEAIIAADLPPTRLNNINLAADSVCGVPVTVNETVDDLVIYATVKTIDGIGKVQASSGPCLVRSTGKLPVLGRMEMDVDDLNALGTSGRLNAVVLHEMLHVVGFGTIWDQVTPSRIVGAGGQDPPFSGPQAIQGCNAVGGSAICANGVPVENCTGISGCGSGTRDSHWRENTFRTELMTGFIESQNTAMPLSVMTVQSLADLGYTVNTASADPYRIPGTAVRAPDTVDAPPSVPWERTRRPGLSISGDGAVSGFAR
jgi:hypothetical protein